MQGVIQEFEVGGGGGGGGGYGGTQSLGGSGPGHAWKLAIYRYYNNYTLR